MEGDWHRDLEQWLEPYLQELGNKTLRRMCPAYIAGLRPRRPQEHPADGSACGSAQL